MGFIGMSNPISATVFDHRQHFPGDLDDIVDQLGGMHLQRSVGARNTQFERTGAAPPDPEDDDDDEDCDNENCNNDQGGDRDDEDSVDCDENEDEESDDEFIGDGSLAERMTRWRVFGGDRDAWFSDNEDECDQEGYEGHDEDDDDNCDDWDGCGYGQDDDWDEYGYGRDCYGDEY